MNKNSLITVLIVVLFLIGILGIIVLKKPKANSIDEDIKSLDSDVVKVKDSDFNDEPLNDLQEGSSDTTDTTPTPASDQTKSKSTSLDAETTAELDELENLDFDDAESSFGDSTLNGF